MSKGQSIGESDGKIDRRRFLAVSGLGLAAIVAASQQPILDLVEEALPCQEDEPFYELNGSSGLCSSWDGLSPEEARLLGGV